VIDLNFWNVNTHLKCYTTKNIPIFWKVTSGLANGDAKMSCPVKRANTILGQRKFAVKEGDKVTEERYITQEDVDAFAELTGDHNPVHKVGSRTSDHPVIVHGALLNGLISGVIGTKLPGPGTVVVSQTLHFPNPCYSGEHVTVTVEITAVRKLIVCKFNCTVNRESRITVLHGEAKLILLKNFSDQTF
jgi:acyl dehydratase